MYLGIDIGTSAVKAVLVGENEALLAEAEEALAIARPHPLWAEQDPQDWWQATVTVLGRLRCAAPRAFAAVRGLGLSGQMHGAVLLDAAGDALRPAILWNDGRAHAECAALARRLPTLGHVAGVPAMPGFTAPKLLWLATNEPETFRRVARVLLPKDYIRFRLTGEAVTDMSDAAGTLWLDEARRDWSDDILAATGLTRAHMPRLVEGTALAGSLQATMAQALGLPAGLPVAGGAGDAAAGGIGIGAVNDGDAFLSLGTSGQYFVTTGSFRPYPEAYVHAFCHALPGRWFQMAALLNGASALGWAAKILAADDIGALLASTEAAFSGRPARPLFLPYLTGERTPHNDPHARGVFFGLAPDVTREEMVQALLEGVAFSFAEAQECLAHAGTHAASVAAIGGGSRSRFWMRLMASALERPITLYSGGAKGPAFGAARLARIATTGEDPAAVCRTPAVAEMIEPDRNLAAAYRPAFARFKRLYQALKSEFRTD
ncbi:xylulokinase [Chelatococcus daeguensis]|uniref:xylulokinase n=1 Tax=Chelatococcus daeguensis TaxID=444444 RepID=UPI0007ABA472|nr:xylulokinase [Chelatococcus daeguensis]KZE35531.1 xylulose kinase [Chelatococcus daeguensis]MBM3085538.1 xylulokinase [Chelatococcus daeguensis]